MTDLIHAIQSYLKGAEQCICITGSGGKTTAMILLAKDYAASNKRVLLSTTTKLEHPEIRDYQCDYYFADCDSALAHTPKQGERVFFAIRGAEKSLAPPLSIIQRLLKRYDVVLLEADGAAKKGLKLHTEKDPVVPDYTTATIAILSFSLLGESLKQACHGAEHVSEQIINLDTYVLLLEHSEGVQKSMKGRPLILCNQAETADRNDIEQLAQRFFFLPLWFGSLTTNMLIQRNMP